MISDLPRSRLSHRKRVAKDTDRDLVPNVNRKTLWFAYFSSDGILLRVKTQKGVLQVTDPRYVMEV